MIPPRLELLKSEDTESLILCSPKVSQLITPALMDKMIRAGLMSERIPILVNVGMSDKSAYIIVQGEIVARVDIEEEETENAVV